MNEQNNCKCKMCSCLDNHPKTKKVLKVVAWIVVVIAVLNLFSCCDERGYSNDFQKDTIVVSGKGEITVKPDIATISFSVMEENLDVSKASDVVNTKIAKIIAKLKSDGVDEKDIKTTGYNIYSRYDYVKTADLYYGGKQVLAGYDVTQSITVKIRDLKNAGKIVTDLGTLGVTDMSGLTFTNDKYDDLQKQARDEAIAEARVEAKKLAKSLGVRLVKIVGYSEGGYNYASYDSRAYATGVSSMKSAEAVIPTGENKITSNVSVTYEIK